MLEGLQSFVSNVKTTTNSWVHSKWSEVKSCVSPRNLPHYTLSEVAEHCFFNDCWIIIYDLVYDATLFLSEHPGGEYIIMENAGRDATIQFRGSRHSKDAFDMLHKYCIGILVENERLYTLSDEELLAQEQSS